MVCSRYTIIKIDFLVRLALPPAILANSSKHFFDWLLKLINIVRKFEGFHKAIKLAVYHTTFYKNSAHFEHVFILFRPCVEERYFIFQF